MSTEHSIKCPCCGGSVVVSIDPGEPRILNPAHQAHPGIPPRIEDTVGCDCFAYLEALTTTDGRPAWEQYEEQVLDRVILEDFDRRR
jgi:hypothetical protein